jgi:transposase-like protein
MGQILHGSATTTGVVRLAIQCSSDSRRALAKRHGINPKTVAKWKKRAGARGPAPLRANKSETFDCLKFTLEGAGERSDGNARTSAHALACRA